YIRRYANYLFEKQGLSIPQPPLLKQQQKGSNKGQKTVATSQATLTSKLSKPIETARLSKSTASAAEYEFTNDDMSQQDDEWIQHDESDFSDDYSKRRRVVPPKPTIGRYTSRRGGGNKLLTNVGRGREKQKCDG